MSHHLPLGFSFSFRALEAFLPVLGGQIELMDVDLF